RGAGNDASDRPVLGVARMPADGGAHRDRHRRAPALEVRNVPEGLERELRAFAFPAGGHARISAHRLRRWASWPLSSTSMGALPQRALRRSDAAFGAEIQSALAPWNFQGLAHLTRKL